MAASALSNTLLCPTTSSSRASSISSKSKFASLSFPSSRSQSVATQLRKIREAKRFTIFCSSEASDGPKEDTPIELKYPAFPTVMDINQIREIFAPHVGEIF